MSLNATKKDLEIKRLLNRVFVPAEDSFGNFRTKDGASYQRDQKTGTVRLKFRKKRGKAARKAEKRARREMRERR